MSQKSPNGLSETRRRARIEAVSAALQRFGRVDDFGLTRLFLASALPHYYEVVSVIRKGISPLPPGVPADYIARTIYRAVAELEDEITLRVGTAEVSALARAPIKSQSDIVHVVALSIENFQRVVRDMHGHELVQGDESRAQILYNVLTSDFATAHGLDLSREVETGRGPVDFKLSAGPIVRVLIEMKRASNSSFWEGLKTQVPIYLKASGINVGHFVPILQDGDTDMDVDVVNAVAKEISAQHGIEIHVNVVDARKPPSASKAKSVDN